MKSLLSKKRYKDIVLLQTNTLDKGSRGAGGWISADVEFSDGSDTTLCFPAVNLKFYQILGMIICQWSVFEFILDEMTEIILAHLGRDEGKWRSTLSYKHRLNLHTNAFNAAFNSYDRIRRYHREVLALVVEPKKVRDGIAHALTIQGLKDGTDSLIFIEDKMRLPTEKRYAGPDLEHMRREICHASGYLERLTTVQDHRAPFSLQEISQLQCVFGHDRLSSAMLQAMKAQPQSSS